MSEAHSAKMANSVPSFLKTGTKTFFVPRNGDTTDRAGELTSRHSGLRGTTTSSKSLGTRTLMSFRGCSTQLGCTILLKGAAADQLAAVKKVTRVGLARIHLHGSQICVALCLIL